MIKKQKVRVFISSTFRDMHSERDYLIKEVFPELRERCLRKGLQLIDVDLRWGVTEIEAEQGKVLEICLDEIENCRPFFIGLLGERYGYVPEEYIVPNHPKYDWLTTFEKGHSSIFAILRSLMKFLKQKNRRLQRQKDLQFKNLFR